jgi:mRNA interferase MazF
MTNYDFGEVVLIHFPQSGVAAKKQRPGIIVLDIGDADIVVAPVTSKLRNQLGDQQIADLNGTGLIRPSWVRLAKVATLLKGEVIRALGRLTPADRQQVVQTWQKLYGDFVS